MTNTMGGNYQPKLQPTEISELTTLAGNSAKQRLQSNVTLNTVLGATECVVNTDSNLLGQVMMNLLDNACKFTPKGAVTFGYEIYDDEIYFFVKDTGVGLSSEQKDRLMDLFESNDTHSPGVGMGLPVVNSIVKSLGGNIGVESRGPGRGATFWFTIPHNTQDDNDAAAPAQEVVVPSEPGRVRILVAEDNESNFILFNQILKHNYDVIHAVDGLQAVEMFKTYHPDLILMDINMPNMDGYQAVKEIRKLSSDVPVIAVTAYAFVTDRQRILEQGFNGYVSKPINMQRLEREINDCLNKTH